MPMQETTVKICSFSYLNGTRFSKWNLPTNENMTVRIYLVNVNVTTTIINEMKINPEKIQISFYFRIVNSVLI